KLTAEKLAIPVIAVESVNRTPTDNPAGVKASLPPPPPQEFEVATIRPSKPDNTNTRARFEHGRIDAENVPLKLWIQFAWDLSGDELIVGAPKFTETAHFDITAKAPAQPAGADVDEDDLRHMLRALIEDRFKLKTHFEERPVDGYVLSSTG